MARKTSELVNLSARLEGFNVCLEESSSIFCA